MGTSRGIPLAELYARLGTFEFPIASIMLERYDAPGRKGIRSGKRVEKEEAPHPHHHRHRNHCALGMVVPILARRAHRRQVLCRGTEAGLQDRLWHLDARPQLVATSRRTSEISLQRVLSRLGTGRRMGYDQDGESERREHLSRAQQRSPG